MTAERALTLRKSDGFDDWYVIEWAEHEGRHWTEPMPHIGANVIGLMYSGRVGDADIEGTADEMRAIAEEIERGGAISFRRCSVRFDGERFALCSPRNSMGDAFISRAQAAGLASEIRRVLPPSADAVDPHVNSTGKLSTRVKGI